MGRWKHSGVLWAVCCGAWSVGAVAKASPPLWCESFTSSGAAASRPGACLPLGGQIPLRTGEVLRSDGDLEVVEVFSDVAEVGTSTAVDPETIRYLPGTHGDVLLALQNLPGVARSPLGVGQLIIRGMAPEDSRYTVNGLEVPLMYHFVGVASIFPGEVIDDMAFTPGVSGARFGGNLGGRVDLQTSLSLPAQSSAYGSLDLFQVAAFGEFRLSGRTSLTVAARRSYVDAVLTPVLSSAQQTFRAPRYYDAQLRLLHLLPGQGSIEAIAFLSDDGFTVLSGDDETLQAVAAGYQSRFQKVQFRWRASLGKQWTQDLTLMVGPEAEAANLPQEERAESRRISMDLREEFRREGQLSWRLGLELQSGPESYWFNLPTFGPEERGETWRVAPAVYAETSIRTGKVTITPGLRAGMMHYAGDGVLQWGLDPRLAVVWSPSQRTDLLFSVGRTTGFSPARAVLVEGDGQAGLRPSWALQGEARVRSRLLETLTLEVGLYGSYLDDLIVGREGVFRFYRSLPVFGQLDTGIYASEGRGWTAGAELGLRGEIRGWTLWTSVTGGTSWRETREGQWHLYDMDQPFVFTALTSRGLPKNWRLGARFRFAVGMPYTPIQQGIHLLELNRFVPVYGERAGGRLPPVYSLDLRVDKTWDFQKWQLGIYLDIQNVTNAQQIEVATWSYDYSQLRGVRGLPILPVFGIRGDWRSR